MEFYSAVKKKRKFYPLQQYERTWSNIHYVK